MKKALLILFLFFPCITFALQNYNESVSLSKKYIEDLPSYDKYLINEKNYHGELITFNEYKKTLNIKNNLSYLAKSELTYWTQSSVGVPIGTKNVIGYNTKYLSEDKKTGTRVCEYVKPNVIVSGIGTEEDPWYFGNIYKVIFSSSNEQLGKIASSSKVQYVYDKTTVELSYIKEHYKYSSITCNNSNLNGTFSNNKLSITGINSDNRCYINFEISEVNVTFDYNDGTGNTTNKTVVIGESHGDLPSITRTGYTLAGWYTEKENGNKVDTNTIVTNTTNYTLYAHWSPNKVVITYNANGGKHTGTNTAYSVDNNKIKLNGSYLTTTIKYGEKLGGTALANPNNSSYLYLEKTGYHFVETNEWSYGLKIYDDDSVSYEANDFCNIDNGDCSIELKANFKANEYTIVYDGNGASGTMTNSTHKYDEAKNLTTNAYTKTGHTFTGWNTKANGTGKSYANNESVKNLTTKNDDTITLYAQWKANTYTVTYISNGGNISITSGTQTYGQNYSNLPDTSRTGYNFDGWYTEIDGGTIVDTSTKVTELSNHILYAHWTGEKVKVKLYNQYSATNLITNGGFESNYTGWNNVSKKYISLDSSTVHTGNYSMKNTGTASDQQGILWATSGISTVKGHIYYGSLYQKSSNSIPVQNHISLGGNILSLSGSTSTKWTRFSGIITGGSKENSSSNYTALEWVNSSYSGNIWLDDVMVIDLTKTFGSGNEPNQSWCDSNLDFFDTTSTVYKEYGEFTATYGSTYGSSLPTLTKSGYTFEGWYTSKTGGTKITSSVTVDTLNTHELYARWTNNSVIYSYTGNVQKYTIPKTGTYKIEAYGAQGGHAQSYSGGKGGYSYGNFSLKKGTVLYIYVGGKGTDGYGVSASGCSYDNESSYSTTAGGYNGGAIGHGFCYSCSAKGNGITFAGAGGGATHVSTSSGLLSSLSSSNDNILIVAGGGGGAIYNTAHNDYGNGNGGIGGGGNNSGGSGSSGAPGGSTTSGAAFGKGGTGTYSYAGGGAGYYGGYATQDSDGNGSAGGGSGYIKSTASNAGGSNGYNLGNGYVKITPQ